jgi:hypothetical protein
MNSLWWSKQWIMRLVGWRSVGTYALVVHTNRPKLCCPHNWKFQMTPKRPCTAQWNWLCDILNWQNPSYVSDPARVETAKPTSTPPVVVVGIHNQSSIFFPATARLGRHTETFLRSPFSPSIAGQLTNMAIYHRHTHITGGIEIFSVVAAFIYQEATFWTRIVVGGTAATGNSFVCVPVAEVSNQILYYEYTLFSQRLNLLTMCTTWRGQEKGWIHSMKNEITKLDPKELKYDNFFTKS